MCNDCDSVPVVYGAERDHNFVIIVECECKKVVLPDYVDLGILMDACREKWGGES